ncbi:hypothetical protein ACVMB3_005338 [Sinorhizobium meliloti]
MQRNWEENCHAHQLYASCSFFYHMGNVNAQYSYANTLCFQM